MYYVISQQANKGIFMHNYGNKDKILLHLSYNHVKVYGSRVG